MTGQQIDRDRLRALAEDAWVDVLGADRCQALGIMPAAHQLHRRLRETARAISELLDALDQDEARIKVEQEAGDAEVEAKIQADTDSLAAEIHEAVEFQYDQCDHGTYHGGHLHGEPYQMCRINAERIVRRRAVRRDEEAIGVEVPSGEARTK